MKPINFEDIKVGDCLKCVKLTEKTWEKWDYCFFVVKELRTEIGGSKTLIVDGFTIDYDNEDNFVEFWEREEGKIRQSDNFKYFLLNKEEEIQFYTKPLILKNLKGGKK